MLVFIDDSGDPGFKLREGSSKFFVISCVVFDDELEALKTSVAIKELKRKLKFPDSVEFKFNKSKKNVRVGFLQKINSFKFKIRNLIVEKKLIRSDELRNNKSSFYSYAIKTILQHSNNTIIDAKIRIDGSGDRIFRKSFLTYLRKQLNTLQKKVVKNSKLIDSKTNELIQMADMIAGAIRRYHEGEKDDCVLYRDIIKKHIVDDWKFK